MKKLPQGFTWPGGYHVKVRVLTDSGFIKAGGGTNDWAFWLSKKDGGTVTLRKSRAPLDRVGDFIHELDHAFVDYKDWLRDRLVVAFQTAPQ